MFHRVTRHDIDSGLPFIVVRNWRPVVTRIRDGVFQKPADITPQDILKLLPDKWYMHWPDGWYRYPLDILTYVDWVPSDEIERLILEWPCITIHWGDIALARMEKYDDKIVWNVTADNRWRWCELWHYVPNQRADGIYAPPPEAVYGAVWPKRVLFNQSTRFGEHKPTTVEQLYSLCEQNGWPKPMLKLRYSQDGETRTVRNYVDIETNEIVLRDEWHTPANLAKYGLE